MMCVASREGGFTLIEILIAMVVLAFGILAVATMQTASGRGNLVGRQVSELNNLAAAQIETLMAIPYDDPLLEDTDPSLTGWDQVPDDTNNNGSLDDAVDDDSADGVPGCVIRWRVIDDQPLWGVKRVDVSAVLSSTGRQVQMTFYKADL